MKRVLTVISAVGFLALTLAPASAAFASQGSQVSEAAAKCTTIQSGKLTDSAGNVITLGFDQFGYNYQAHTFNGTYDSSDRELDGKYWGQEVAYANDKLEMKWSNAWLANVDCDKDGKLDRGLANGVATGSSRGWLTNHISGTYLDANNVAHHYTDFIKIGWVGPSGDLWGEFTIIQEVYNDPAGGFHGLLTKAEPGLGAFVEHP